MEISAMALINLKNFLNKKKIDIILFSLSHSINSCYTVFHVNYYPHNMTHVRPTIIIIVYEKMDFKVGCFESDLITFSHNNIFRSITSPFLLRGVPTIEYNITYFICNQKY